MRSSHDDEKRHSTFCLFIPIDATAHCLMIGDCKTVMSILKMLDRQSMPHSFDQTTEQRKRIVARITHNLELIASRRSIANLKGFERNDIAKQATAKVKFMKPASTIRENDRPKCRTSDAVPLVQFGHFRIETAPAKLLVALVHRAIVDHVVTGYELAAFLTTNLHHILPLNGRRAFNQRYRTDYS
jgi:serine/threonine protein phosphatase PrpC